MSRYKEYGEKFLEIVESVFTAEGGEEFTNNPSDPGGATKFGITLTTLRAYRKQKDASSVTTIQDVQDLTKDDAMEIYFNKYYKEPGINTLPEALQDVVFDNAVNVGVARAVKELQEELSDLKVDGWLGPLTKKRAFEEFARLGTTLIANYAKRRWGFYIDLVLKNPALVVFLKGWGNRILRFFSK